MAVRDSDLESQQPAKSTYVPSAPGRADNPQIPPGIPGTQSQGDFVVSTYDARPSSGYDGFQCINSDVPSFSTQIGYVTILRHMAITAYHERTLVSATGEIVDRWGFPNVTPDLLFDLLVDTTPAKNLSAIPINAAACATLNIACYVPIDENVVVQPVVRLGPASTSTGIVKYTIDVRYNQLPKTGSDIDSQASNLEPIFVRATRSSGRPTE